MISRPRSTSQRLRLSASKASIVTPAISLQEFDGLDDVREASDR
jgi:hypothetical protein